MRAAVLFLASALSVTACGSGDEASSPAVSSNQAESPPTVEVVASGFGQRRDYALAVVIVTSDDENAVGEFVKVHLKFLDSDGEIIATHDPVASLSWVGQELVMTVGLGLTNDPQAVATVEASAEITNYGEGLDPLPPLKSVDASEIAGGDDRDYVAGFELRNETADGLEKLNVPVVCYDPGGTIIGGAIEFIDQLPAGETIRLTSGVVTSVAPASCTAFPYYGS